MGPWGGGIGPHSYNPISFHTWSLHKTVLPNMPWPLFLPPTLDKGSLYLHISPHSSCDLKNKIKLFTKGQAYAQLYHMHVNLSNVFNMHTDFKVLFSLAAKCYKNRVVTKHQGENSSPLEMLCYAQSFSKLQWLCKEIKWNVMFSLCTNYSIDTTPSLIPQISALMKWQQTSIKHLPVVTLFCTWHIHKSFFQAFTRSHSYVHLAKTWMREELTCTT